MKMKLCVHEIKLSFSDFLQMLWKILIKGKKKEAIKTLLRRLNEVSPFFFTFQLRNRCHGEGSRLYFLSFLYFRVCEITPKGKISVRKLKKATRA
jgi:hypothetical protein